MARRGSCLSIATTELDTISPYCDIIGYGVDARRGSCLSIATTELDTISPYCDIIGYGVDDNPIEKEKMIFPIFRFKST
ncbi:unnamed protein product [Rotaria socialis]